MKHLIVLFILTLSAPIFAQNSTWKQEVNSIINVELDTEDNILKGTIEIEYFNNSPDTLNEIYFHLYPNAYSSNKSAFSKQLIEQGKKDFYFADKSEQGFISELQFFVNGIGTPIQQFNNQVDIAVLSLNAPLLSGEKAIIRTPFTIQLPKLWSRMGVENNVYHITQWYPKPAVYDKNGWHPMPYLDQGEFYYEYGKYDVTITLPSNMVVAATGELQTKEEQDWLQKLATKSKKGIQNDYNFDEAQLIKERSGKKTINFQQENVHDFAWFASSEFLLLEDVIKVQGESKLLQSFFTEDNVFTWEYANQFLEQGMKFYSEKIGPYPYSTYKAVGADISTGGGMEYPMVTVIENYQNDLALKEVLVHELGHSWFQGVLGSNERKFPWLDEGINSFYEEYALAEDVGVKELNFEDLDTFLPLVNSLGRDQPIEYPSENYFNTNYWLNVYGEGAKAMNYLREYLGDEAFDKGMQNYYETWKFNHPYPEDLQKSFDNSEQLNFFFKDIIKENKSLNYTLHAVQDNEVIVINKGKVDAPFTLDYLDNNDKILYSEWIDGFSGTQTIPLKKDIAFDKIAIFHRPIFYETDRSDNVRTKQNKNARKVEFLTPFTAIKDLNSVVGTIENKQLFASPIIGWNNYDKAMIGGLITNTSVLKKDFEYQLMPMYAMKTKDLVGMGNLSYHIRPNVSKSIKELTPYIKTQHFHFNQERYELDYFRNEIGATIDFTNKKEQPNRIEKSFSVNAVGISQRPIPIYDVATQNYQEQDRTTDLYYNLDYVRENARKINPNKLELSAQLNESFSKISGEYSYKYEFEPKNRYFNLRAFGGVVTSNKDDMPFAANFSAIGRNGTNDYDYSQLYFYRDNNDSFLNNLWTQADGGIKSMQNFAQPVELYGDTMFALNGEITAPFNLPIGQLMAYSDVVLFHKSSLSSNTNDGNSMLYDAGLSYKLGDVFQVYYPLLLSKEFKPETDLEELKFQDKLVFQFNFNPLNMKQSLRKKARSF